MFVGKASDYSISVKQRKRRRRHSSLFFSSRKVRNRAKMTKAKKTSSRGGHASRGSTQEVLNFGSRSTAGEDDGGVISIGGAQDAFGDAGSSLMEGTGDVEASNVSLGVLGF